MKRAVWLLVALFAAWLLALPASALAARPSAAGVTHTVAHAQVASSIEALPAALDVVRVAPAPLLARLPAVVPALWRSCTAWPRLRLLEAAPRDARRELSRVQVRRAVPRLNDAEPPWSSAR